MMITKGLDLNYTPKFKIGEKVEINDGHVVHIISIEDIITSLNYEGNPIPMYSYMDEIDTPTYIYCELADPYMRKII